jgi:hypothetical protein
MPPCISKHFARSIRSFASAGLKFEDKTRGDIYRHLQVEEIYRGQRERSSFIAVSYLSASRPWEYKSMLGTVVMLDTLRGTKVLVRGVE